MAGFTVGADQVGCRAWINFNGSNIAIRDDYNVSSLADNGTGNYTVYIDADVATTTYAAIAGGRWQTQRAGTHWANIWENACKIRYDNAGTTTAADSDTCTLVIFGN